MKRNFEVVGLALLALAFVAYACAAGEVVQGDINAAGAAGSTGTAGTGSPVGIGGTTGTAGTGAGATSGSTGTRGGNTGTAGTATSRGGNTGTAGTVSTGRGGNTGAGGTVNPAGSGGTVSPAGSGGTASPAGTGGSSSSACGSPSFAVSADGFVQMPVSQNGCWSGYPGTYADTYGSMVMPTSFSSCGMPCMLRMTGTLVAVSGSMYSYAGMGFNLGQTPAGGPTNTPVTPRGSGLVINFTNSTTGTGVVLRAQVTDGPTNTWCTTVTTSPASIPYSSFRKACYDAAPGAAYNKEPINAIQLNLAGGTTSGAINLTINSVTEMP